MTDTSAPAFLRACRGEQLDRPPVWFMRQAGRALPEYRARRGAMPMLEACNTPDVVVDVTLQPVDRYGVDAAILFSDIVVPIKAVGVDLDIVPGVGPVVASPIATAADLDQLRPLEPEDVAAVSESVRLLVKALAVPLIGFVGAPFTVASYLVEGGPSRQHLKTKAMMYARPDLWDALMHRLVGILSTSLRLQIDAGVQAIQLFDSWAGTLSEADYRRYVLPHSAAVLASVPDVPRIHFGVGTAELLPAMGDAGADVVGVDWRTPLDTAARRVKPGKALQGNLDPALVATAPWEVIASAVDDVIARGRAASGHIFNLGHGVLPETDPDVLTRIVARIHETPPPPA